MHLCSVVAFTDAVAAFNRVVIVVVVGSVSLSLSGRRRRILLSASERSSADQLSV